MKEGMSVAEWAKEAGLDWQAMMVPAFAQLPDGEMRKVENHNHIVRNDTGHPLGYVTNRYKPVQPSELLDWFQQYISVDDRFQLDVAGSLKQGEIIWATATFNGGVNVAGDNFIMRLLMTTTYDGTGATVNKGTTTRVVCNNTLDVALMAGGCGTIKTRHCTKFDAEKVGKELSEIVKGFDKFKAMGDAMVQVRMAKEEVSNFFKICLDIPFDVKAEDVSTRKMNQFHDLNAAYLATVKEGTQPDTMWCALNAVTRYVDHDRSTRTIGNADETRVLSSQFGSGANMKSKAVKALIEMAGGKLKVDA